MAYKTKRNKNKKQQQPGPGMRNPYDPVDEKALAAHDKAALNPKQSADEIIKLLQAIADDGYPPGDIFIDFLHLTEVMLDELPRHVRSIRKTGRVDFNDPPEIQEFYANLRGRYPPQKRWIWGNLTAAVSLLGFVSAEIPQDTIGQVYARFAHPENKAIIPTFNQAVKRAGKALGRKATDRVYEHMADAGLKAAKTNPLAASIIETGLLGGATAKTARDDEWVQKFTRDNILPAILPYYEPVRVFDPNLGSGTLIIAGSTLFPDWAVTTGMVRFEGTDPDPLCVRMATLNAKIYGLNGYHIKVNRALLDETDGSLPDNFPDLPDCFRKTEAEDDDPRIKHAQQITLL